MGLIQKIFGTHSENELKRIYPIVDAVEALEPEIQKLSDDELKGKTREFKKRLADGETLDDILPEAYAVVREASSRTNVLNMRHFPVQLMGGIVMHQGRIAEMKTGEGKTLTAVMCVYLNALAQKGLHVITVNEYLANRDAEWMGEIYRFLGLSVGVNMRALQPHQKRAAYFVPYSYFHPLGIEVLNFPSNIITSERGYSARFSCSLVFLVKERFFSTFLDIAGQLPL